MYGEAVWDWGGYYIYIWWILLNKVSCQFHIHINVMLPAGIFLFKVNNRNTTTMCEIRWKLVIKAPRMTSMTSVSIMHYWSDAWPGLLNKYKWNVKVAEPEKPLLFSFLVAFFDFRFETLFETFCYFLWLKSRPKYLTQTLDFMWKSTAGKVEFLFFRNFWLILAKFSFLGEDWALGYNFMNFSDFEMS